MCSVKCQKIFFLVLGCVLLVIGGIMSAVWPFIFNYNIRNVLVLSDSSESSELWKSTPIPMYIDFYLFNWTNPEETLNNKAVPRFNEIGPYVFTENHVKANIIWNRNGTVTFKQIRKWVFVPDLSVGALSDEITNVNVVAMTIGNVVKRSVPKWAYPIINKAIQLEHKVYITKTVGELLFYGYHDIFLDIAKDLEPIIKMKIPMDKFGWFYNRNMSVDYDGVFNMMTGESSLDDLGTLTTWNLKSHTKYFPGECGNVAGSTGELWPIDAADNSVNSIFATDLCSKLDVERLGATDIYGAVGSVFVGTSNTFNNNTQCYCVNNVCHPNGLREISTCRYGAPAFISFPHFYLADPSLKEMVAGMEPSERKHKFDITLHKATGVPLSVNARLQINILVDKIPGIKFYEKLPKAYMPMVWFNQRALITPELASKLSELQIFTWFEPGFFVVAGIGAVAFFIGLFLWSNARWKQSVLNSPLLEESSTS